MGAVADLRGPTTTVVDGAGPGRGGHVASGAMLICHHDVTSPAAAVAVLRLQALADAGGHVAFRGLDVLGLETTVPATLDQLEQLPRYAPRAAELGLTMRRPRLRPPTLGVHLVADHAESLGLGASWRSACLHAYWEDGADLGDDELVADLAAAAGLDRAVVAALLADRPARIALRRRMGTLRGRGVGGVPVLEYQGTLVSAELSDDDLRQLT
ncbi:hypothetical protein FTX61_08590 [Nitriliruptoraceae bacterium ZYF776]|nr:hypothetical protein [Profundirhabdus halotolerans]